MMTTTDRRLEPKINSNASVVSIRTLHSKKDKDKFFTRFILFDASLNYDVDGYGEF